MRTNFEIIKDYINSIDYELDRIVNYHRAAQSELLNLADVFIKSKTEPALIVAKGFVDIEKLIMANINLINKMKFEITRKRVILFFYSLIRFLRETNYDSFGLEYFSWMVDKVSTNLEESSRKITIMISPLLEKDKKSYDIITMMVTSVFDKVLFSKNGVYCIKEILSKINSKTHNDTPSLFSEVEQKIYETLIVTIPSAAFTYMQAVKDLEGVDRLSYRGVANEFREALRETLDFYGPDEKVIAQPGFKLEQGRLVPTMKQKARYILKSVGMNGNATRTSEEALEIIEERIASITRATYDRSSKSSHIATERDEVQKIKHYVNIVLIELLKIKL